MTEEQIRWLSDEIAQLKVQRDAALAERDEALREHTDMMWQRRRAEERADAADERRDVAEARADRFASVATEMEKRALAAEGEVEKLKVRMDGIRQAAARRYDALIEARREIVAMAEAGVQRLADYGCVCDPAERTYGPAVARIDAALLPVPETQEVRANGDR